MTEAATPGPLPPPPPRSGPGCVWGCLAGAVIAVLAIIGAFSYLGWYFTSGFKNDQTLQFVIQAVNADFEARALLGDGVEIAGMSSTAFSDNLTTGKTASYVLQLRGSKGAGTLNATVVIHGKTRRITVLVLTTNDGRIFDLLRPGRAPPGAI